VLYSSIVSLQHGPHNKSAISHSRPLPVSFDGKFIIPEAQVPEDSKMALRNWAPDSQEMDDNEWLLVRDTFTVPISLEVEQPVFKVEVGGRDQEDLLVKLDCPALKRHLGDKRDPLLSEPQIAHLVQGIYSVSSLSRRWKMLNASTRPFMMISVASIQVICLLG
jgi:hypothetical protein